MKNVLVLFVFSSLLIICGCELQKRIYRNGYYVNNKNKQNYKETKYVSTTSANYLSKQLTASASKVYPKKETAKFKLISLAPDSCDLIYFKDGTQIKCKIIDLTNKELQYKYCDFEDQKTHISSRLLLVRIEYANGVIEDFENGVSVKVQPGKTHQMTDVPKPVIPSFSKGNDTVAAEFVEAQAPTNSTVTCERIMFRNGNEADVKLIEITPDEVRYKMCDMLGGPVFVKDKSEIFMVVHQNGTKEIFNKKVVSSPNEPRTAKAVKPRNGLAITGFVFSLLGFYPLIGFGSLAGLILGIIYLKKHKLLPEVYDHPRMAQTAIILSSIVLAIIAIAFIITFI